MRKSSNFNEKLYINDKALCVVGDKIKLLEQQKPQRGYTRRNIKLSVEVPEESSTLRVAQKKRSSAATKRQTFKLNASEYKNTNVCNKQLKQIYETVEIEDFERILRNLYVSNEYKKRERNRTDDIIARVKPEEIYEHFFGQHYDYLNNLSNRS